MNAYNKGSKTGSRSHPCAQFTRFTADENARLVRMCRKRGLTVQAFMHAAAMRALNEATLGIRERLEDKRRDDDERDNIPAPTIAPPAPPAPPPAQSHVPGDEIIALARTIVDSPVSARRDVMQAACRVLARGRSTEESLRLADELDATIKRLGGITQTALERARARVRAR